MDKLNYRITPDGKMIFLARGDPPKEVEGYRPTTDPYIFELDLPPCPHRSNSKRVKPCGKVDYPLVCSHFKQIVTLKICDECEVEV